MHYWADITDEDIRKAVVEAANHMVSSPSSDGFYYLSKDKNGRDVIIRY